MGKQTTLKKIASDLQSKATKGTDGKLVRGGQIAQIQGLADRQLASTKRSK